ncbi:hypothetical protein ACFVYP_33315 [Kitasatospora sp. NPDC058201]|uniref:hypothetical protein n=1 Tax=unclassified Kitasatospora TaxID=2633591 RepID=UPI0036651F01
MPIDRVLIDPESTSFTASDLLTLLARQFGPDWNPHPGQPPRLCHTDGFTVTVQCDAHPRTRYDEPAHHDETPTPHPSPGPDPRTAPAPQPNGPYDTTDFEVTWTLTDTTHPTTAPGQQPTEAVHGATLLDTAIQAMNTIARMKHHATPPGPGRIDILLLHDTRTGRLTTTAWNDGILMTDTPMPYTTACHQVNVHHITAPAHDLPHTWFEHATRLPVNTPAAVTAWVRHTARAHHPTATCDQCRPGPRTSRQPLTPQLRRVLQQIVNAEPNGVANAIVLYADALTQGAIEHTEDHPAVLAALYPQHTGTDATLQVPLPETAQAQTRAAHTLDNWRRAIHRLHLLAVGLLTDSSNNEQRTHKSWPIDARTFPDGYTITTLRQAFNGDVAATAAAIVEALTTPDRHPITTLRQAFHGDVAAIAETSTIPDSQPDSTA